MISAVCWKWGALFSATYVNRLHAMLARNLHLPFRLHCITDNAAGIDRDIICLPLPTEFAGTPRCRRRMKMYDRSYAEMLGRRILALDLDIVITDDITALVERPEPIVLWRVGYANVFSGSFQLYDAGAMHGAYTAFAADPEHYPARTGERNASDQAMLNLWLRESRAETTIIVPSAIGKTEHGTKHRPLLGVLTDANGIVTYFGAGYEQLEHRGVGPNRPQLPPGTRMVVMGSRDKMVMDNAAFPWVVKHWR